MFYAPLPLLIPVRRMRHILFMPRQMENLPRHFYERSQISILK